MSSRRPSGHRLRGQAKGFHPRRVRQHMLSREAPAMRSIRDRWTRGGMYIHGKDRY